MGAVQYHLVITVPAHMECRCFSIGPASAPEGASSIRRRKDMVTACEPTGNGYTTGPRSELNFLDSTLLRSSFLGLATGWLKPRRRAYEHQIDIHSIELCAVQPLYPSAACKYLLNDPSAVHHHPPNGRESLSYSCLTKEESGTRMALCPFPRSWQLWRSHSVQKL